MWEHSWKCCPVNLFSFYICYFQFIYCKWWMFSILIQGFNSECCAFSFNLQFFKQSFLYKISLTTIIKHSPGSNHCVWYFRSNLSWYHTHAYDLVHLDAHINPVLSALSASFFLISLTNLPLSFFFNYKPCNIVGSFPLQSLHFIFLCKFWNCDHHLSADSSHNIVSF